MQIRVFQVPNCRWKSSSPPGGSFTNGNFLYKCKFHLQKEKFILLFSGSGGQGKEEVSLSASVGSQLSSAQNNSYTKEAYFRAAYSGSLQYHNLSDTCLSP